MFAIASGVILILTFIVKEILKENLKGLHDSVAQAESQFRTESGQLTVAGQILLVQQQAETFKFQEEALKKTPDPNRDYSALIAQDIVSAQQAVSQLNSEFDTVSRLIDALPPEERELRQIRDTLRTSVERVVRDTQGALTPRPDHNVGRFVQVKMAMVMAFLEELPVVMLGDSALTTAQRVEGESERWIRVCSRAIYVLGLLGLSLGLYAAIAGIKTDSSD